jgi:hypothetical protein
MQDSKDSSWRDAYSVDAERGDEAPADIGGNTQSKDTGVSTDPAENQDGWQQYRRWISKAPAPRGRRSGLDPSLYTWKGYRSWTEQIKRNWSDS